MSQATNQLPTPQRERNNRGSRAREMADSTYLVSVPDKCFAASSHSCWCFRLEAPTQLWLKYLNSDCTAEKFYGGRMFACCSLSWVSAEIAGCVTNWGVRLPLLEQTPLREHGPCEALFLLQPAHCKHTSAGIHYSKEQCHTQQHAALFW